MNGREPLWAQFAFVCLPTTLSLFVSCILPCGLFGAGAAAASGANQKKTMGIACAAMVCACVALGVWVVWRRADREKNKQKSR
jgi:predicted permease